MWGEKFSIRKNLSYLLALCIPLALVAGMVCQSFMHLGAQARTSNCISTNYTRAGVALTAALVNPVAPVTGQVNATGCDIGVYYGKNAVGVVSGAEVYGATSYGVLINGARITVYRSRIHDIGDMPFSSARHGVAVYFAYNSGAIAAIADNSIWRYQEAGIVVGGPRNIGAIYGNALTGLGPINFIAQTGIQVNGGAKVRVTNNIVSGNIYTGSKRAVGTGILLAGGSCYQQPLTIRLEVNINLLLGNDVGIWTSNMDAHPSPVGDCQPSARKTTLLVSGNATINDNVYNRSGAGPNKGYQAALVDQGNDDTLTANVLCGPGYTPGTTPPPYLYYIDDTFTKAVHSNGNFECRPGVAFSPLKPTRIHLKLHPLPLVIL